jgi:type IV pilus assembly protein PilO
MAIFASLRAQSLPSVDLNQILDWAAVQFQGLNLREPGQWPLLPRATVWALTLLLVTGAGWALVISEAFARLEVQRAREPVLREQFRTKLNQATNLEELRKQKLQVQEYVNQLEKQLPGKADLDGVLSDINQSGMGRGLLFDSFKPGAMVVREHYAEWPISLKVTGKYHDIGSFLADIARLPRIVTLHDMVLTGPGLSTPGQTATPHAAPALMLEATARTYRYVAAGEAAAAKTAASPPGASNAQVSRAVASKAAAKGEKK